MAVTIARTNVVQLENANMFVFTIKGPASYATGGDAVGATDWSKILGGTTNTVSDVTFFGSEKMSGTTPIGLHVAYDFVNSKWVFYGVGAEVPATTNLSAQTVKAYAIVAGQTSKDAA